MSTETVLRSSGVVTTILGVLNQFQSFTDLVYRAQFDTTLNSKYGVLNSSAYQEPRFTPTLKYFGIGVKGFQNIDLQQAALPYPGDARCMDLYAPIPFRCVPTSQDLTQAERDLYRMRVVQTINGIEYALYYLKKIEFNNSVEIIKKDADGNSSEYHLSPEQWLRPSVPDLNQIGGNINTNVNRIIVRAKGQCKVTHEEIIEGVSVLFNNDMEYARISELGYYTGNDIAFNADGSEAADDVVPAYTEAAYVQLAKHHCFTGSSLSTAGSYILPTVSLESECCINGSAS